MSNYSKEQLQELSMNIIKDSKRRTVYYDPVKKEGYLLQNRDRNWILLLDSRYPLTVMSSILLINFFPQYLLIWLGMSAVMYFVIRFWVNKKFFSVKTSLKVAQKDVDLLYQPEVLKHKRTFEFYYVTLAVIITVYIITFLGGTDVSFNVFTKVIAIAYSVMVLILRLIKFLAIHNQYKIASKSIK